MKTVERYVGFERKQTEYGGHWAMARYIEATEVHDKHARDAMLSEIVDYNREDLAATWAVLCWLQELVGRAGQTEHA